jgi:hypothetical protein
MATSASDQVANAFSAASGYASSAQIALSTFTTALNASVYAPPTISMTWRTITPPTLPTLPSVPSMPTIAYSGPSSTPSSLAITAPTLTLDTFSETAPITSFPTAPTLNYGTTPAIHSVAAISVPSAPTITLPDAPSYLSLITPTLASVDLHTAYLDNLTTIPTLALVEPTPYSYSPGPDYSSSLLSALTSKLLSRIAGGSGLTPAVEQALWDRLRDRETNAAQANIDQIMRSSEALGFQLPAGVIAAQTREAEQNYYDKISELSRDISVKQAELEQSNLKDAIAAGMQLEGQLIDYSYKLEQLTFEGAKAYAENAIAAYNAQVDGYKALMTGYQTYAAAYDTIIKGELAKVDIYKAQVDGEQAKADVNRSLVEQYKASIDAVMSGVEIFKAQVEGAKVLVEIEQAKVNAGAEQVRAYVAQINAETAKIEAYKAGVEAENTKVEVYKTKAAAFATTVGAKAEQLRTQLGYYESLTRSKTLEWDGYRAQVDAERARLGALTAQSSTLLDGYKAGAAAIEATANMQSRLWETQIKDYEASQSLSIQVAKINNDATLANRAANLDAAKVGAQVYAQLASSAYGIIHAQAQVSQTSGMTVGYQYSNGTMSAAPTTTSI